MSKERLAELRLLKSSSFEVKLALDSAESASILAYPSGEPSVVAARIGELLSLGVKSLQPYGKTMIANTTVLGKGCVGVVVKAHAPGDGYGKSDHVYALKARRIDANRNSMKEEARLHNVANSAGVGPLLRNHSENFLLMDFVDGPNILEWAEFNTGVSVDFLGSLALSILEQCYQLDSAGIDHGQLSKIDRHVIISLVHRPVAMPVIIDFESASTTRRPANVTSAAQALFIGGGLVAKRIGGRLCSHRDRPRIIDALKSYKEARTRARFERVLQSLNLTSYSF